MKSSALALPMTALIVLALLYYGGDTKDPPPATKPATPAKPHVPKQPHSPPRGPHCPSWPHGTAAASWAATCGCQDGLPCRCGNDCRCASTCRQGQGDGKPQLGGPDSPDGMVHICFDLDTIDWPRNINSRGLGCCGFRAMDYCARIAGETAVTNLPEKLRDAGIAGGDYPDKHASVMRRLCPGVQWWQDTDGSLDLLEASCRSKRPCCVDYNGHDPHYSGGIAHCVTCVACDVEAGWVCILDNNYPKLDQLVWMDVAAFRRRWGGWSYGLLKQTPGHYDPALESYLPRTLAERAEGPLFGLQRQGPWGSGASINGEKASKQAILDRLGPAMAPIQVPHVPVDVDHKLDLDALKPYAIGAVLMFLFLTWKKDKEGK